MPLKATQTQAVEAAGGGHKKLVLGIIAAVAVLVIIAVLVLQIPGVTPVTPPPTGGPTPPPVNTSDAEKKLGPGSAILTATGKVSAGVMTEVIVNVYYIGGRSANDICSEGRIVLKSCEQTLTQAPKCETVDFTCSAARAGDLQDTVTLTPTASASSGKSYVVSLEKYGTYTDVVMG